MKFVKGFQKADFHIFDKFSKIIDLEMVSAPDNGIKALPIGFISTVEVCNFQSNLTSLYQDAGLVNCDNSGF